MSDRILLPLLAGETPNSGDVASLDEAFRELGVKQNRIAWYQLGTGRLPRLTPTADTSRILNNKCFDVLDIHAAFCTLFIFVTVF